MANHLIIGLGGTGGNILRSFRKAIYQNFRSVEPAGLKVDYLYVDSDDKFMAHDDPTWKILGQSVQLDKTNQLVIKGIDLARVFDSLASLPGISPWLGSRDLFRNILNAADAANIFGAQKRRLGRFLFACRASDYCNQIRALVTGLQTGGITDTTFHICCGLAGGTGSGTVIDAVSQIRAMYPDKQYKILVYVFLPDKNPPPKKLGVNYHANGYAALMELNALSIGALKPYDVTGVLKGRLELSDPFNCCYLFTDENEDHNRMDVDEELPEIVASFLYQKIVAAREMAWDALDRHESFQIGSSAIDPETSPSRVAERSRRFLTFGIKQIAYPEEEIREYLTYSFARQAALQLQHNHWSDADGYIDEPVNQAFASYVEQKDVQESWLITDDHLILSEGILEYEIKNPQWKPIGKNWSELLNNYQHHVRENFPKQEKAWLSELAILCETAYSQNYRNVGVARSYQIVLANPRDHVREVRRRVEGELFGDWRKGTRSMQDISRLIAALQNSLKDRLVKINEQIVRRRADEAEYQRKVDLNAKEWPNIGFLGGMMGKHEDLFNAQAQCLRDVYICRTNIQGLQFAVRFIPLLQAEFADLANEVSKCASMIAESTKAFTNSISERCTDNGQSELKGHVVRFYQPELVKSFARALIQDKNEQQNQTAEVRKALAGLLGTSQNFTTFNNKIPGSAFIETLEKTCEANSIISHNNYITANRDRAPVLRVSVIERLYREYSGNREALKSYILSIVSRAKNFLAFNSLEQRLEGPGIPAPSESCLSDFTIIMPEAPELGEFREALVDAFGKAKTGQVNVVANPRKGNEISLVSITSCLPARFVADVEFLKTKYELRTSGDTASQARMELHTEGDGSQFPSLFVRRATPAGTFPFLLVAHAMNLIRALEDPDTGESGVYLITKNDKGKAQPPTLLGRTLLDAVEAADLSRLDSLEANIRSLLAGEYLHKTKREELISAIDKHVAAVLEERKNNPLDKTYKRYYEAGQRAEVILNQRS
jgi:Tubulin like